MSKRHTSLPDQPCQACGTPAPGDVFVCTGCMDAYHGHLAAIPEIIDDLEVELTRQSRKTAGPGGRHHDQPIPFGVAASDLLHELRTILTTSCRALALLPEDLPDDTVPAMLTWLVHAETSIPLRVEGPDVTAGVAAWIRRARRLCDTPAERKFIGRCHCYAELYATDDQPLVTCRECEGEWHVESIRRSTAAHVADALDAKLGTLSEIRAALATLGTPRSRKTLESWVTRGRLPKRGLADGGHLYSYADAISLAAPRVA